MAECPSTPGCPGDPAYASPGRGHWDVCQHPLPYDGDPEALEFRATQATTDAMAGAMTIVYLFGAAVRDGNEQQRQRLSEIQKMLEAKAPFKDIGQVILETMGPLWTPDAETMKAIEAINRRD